MQSKSMLRWWDLMPVGLMLLAVLIPGMESWMRLEGGILVVGREGRLSATTPQDPF